MDELSRQQQRVAVAPKRVKLPSKLIFEPLWDTVIFANGDSGDKTIFQANTVGSMGLLHTNMETAGQIPQRQRFYLYGFSCPIYPKNSAGEKTILDDVQEIFSKTVLKFRLGQATDIFRIPLILIPSGLGIWTPSVVAGEKSPAQNGAPSHKGMYLFPKGEDITIEGGDTFSVVLSLASSLSLTAQVKMWVVMWGKYLKSTV